MNPELATTVAELLGISVEDLAELTHADIIERLGAVFDEAATADNATEPDALVRIRAIAAAVGEVRAEQEVADAEAAEAEAEIAALRAQIAGETPPPDPDEENGEPAAEPGEADPAPAEEAEAETTDAPTAEATAPVPVAARVAVARSRAHAPRDPETPRSLVTITAAADVPGHSAGGSMANLRAVGEAFARRAGSLLGGPGSHNTKIDLATFSLAYDESRTLRAGADAENWRKVAEVDALMPAIVASGGLCAPVAARYELEGISGDHRPIRDALNRFNADRGGIRFITPPTIADLAAGVDIITAAEDAADATKPCVEITCGTPVEVDIAAVSKCVKVGNFSRRTFPEQFARFWQLASAQHAREAEGFLLDGIGAASVTVTDGQNLGAALDILEAVRRAASAYRSRNRMLENARLIWFAPQWLPDLMAADLYRQIPGDGPERLRITTMLITSMFNDFNVSPVWYADTETGEGQVFAAQGAGALLGWPTTPVTYLTHPGAFLFLDGGELNLGLEIRDSTLNSTNDVMAHTETFENVAFVGIESEKIEHSVCISGATSATVTVTCPENS